MDRSAPRSLAPSLTALALTFGAAVPLARLFRTGGLWPVVIIAAVGSAGVAALTRRFGIGPFLAWIAQGVSLFLFISYRFAFDTLAGPLPTARTLGALGDRLSNGAHLINAESAPIVAHPEVLIYIALGVWVTTWLVDLSFTVVGNPLLAVASAIPLFAMPGTLVTSERRVLETVAFIVPAAIVVLAHEKRRRRSWRGRPAGALILAALIPTLLLTPILPGFGAAPLLPGQGDRRQVFNPFVAIKPALDRSRESLLFTVATTRAGYHRLTALDSFDGKVWSQSSDQRRLSDVGRDLPASQHLGPTVDVAASTEIVNLGGIWVPVAYDPVQVEAKGAFGDPLELVLDDEPRALLYEQSFTRGITIASRSRVPVPQARDLDRIPFAGTDERYLALPRNLPRRIAEIAEKVTEDATTPFRKAVALQAYLRTFTYDEDVAAGHSFSTLVQFLTEVQRGYCEQFAGAMAVMARAVDLQSRVIIGFTAGKLIGRQNGRSIYRVTSRHAHAWVEIYFPSQGWVAFEPTPRSGFATPPGYTSPDLDELSDGTPSPTPSTTTTAAPSARPSASPTTGTGAADAGGGFPMGPLLALGGTAIVGGALLAVAPRLRRRRRGGLAAFPSYADLLAWCAAAGFGRRPAETPREHLVRVAAATGIATHDLADPLDLVLWADAPQDAIAARLVGVRKALAAELGARRRLVAGIRWHVGRSGTSPAAG